MKLILIFFLISFAFADARRTSELPFNEGVAHRLSNSPLETCGDGRNLSLFCREGWFMADAFSTWTYQRNLKETWPFPLPLTELQAISIGLALRFSGNKSIPPNWWNLGKMSRYLADGWGFADEYLKAEKGKCPLFLMDYCSFGSGRASYFTGRKVSHPASQKGHHFARAMHGETTQDIDKSIAQLSRAILNRNSDGIESMMSCLNESHAFDCTR